MGLPVPRGLSPSSMGAFTECPLAFRFAYIERLPEPPSLPATRGTLVHLALQKLMWRPAGERTLDRALADLAAAEAEMAAGDPDLVDLHLDAAAREQLLADAAELVRRYFELEDPTTVNAIGLEIKLHVDVGGVVLRGIIDRLDYVDGDLVVTDYKTGASPDEMWWHRSQAGVNAYALMCEEFFGRRPARVQLLYLSTPEALVHTPSESLLRGVRAKSAALMDAVETACAREAFRPRRSRRCEWCTFQEFCPEFGGDPAQAAVVLRERAAEAAGRPPLPLATV